MFGKYKLGLVCRLLQFNARHVAALGNPKKPVVAAQTLVAMQLAKKVEDWDLQKESGVFATSGRSLYVTFRRCFEQGLLLSVLQLLLLVQKVREEVA